MTNTTESSRYHDLFRRAREGDEAAFYDLYAELAEPLLRMANREIGDWLAKHYSPEAAVQSVLGSAFVSVQNGRYEYRSNAEMWGWIAMRLRFHVARKIEKLNAIKRQPEAQLHPDYDAPDRPLMTQEELTGLSDAVDCVLKKVSPEDAELLITVMRSSTKTEAADKLGITRWYLNQRLARLRSLFRKALGWFDSGDDSAG